MTAWRVVTPAPIAAAVDFLVAERPLSWWRRKAAVLQLARSETVAIADADGIAALVGLMPEGNVVTVWFAIRAGDARALRPALRLARLTRARLGDSPEQAGLTLRAEIAAGHEPGRRLARLAGLRHTRTVDATEHWEWQAG